MSIYYYNECLLATMPALKADSSHATCSPIWVISSSCIRSVPLVSVSDDSCLDSSGRTATGACFPCVGRVPSEDEANPDSRKTEATAFSFGPSQTMVRAPETESILASLHLSLPSFFASLFYVRCFFPSLSPWRCDYKIWMPTISIKRTVHANTQG